MMEIVEDIHWIDEASKNIAHSNVYLVINNKELMIIDTGTAGNAKKTVEYIQKLGHQPNEVSTIILTHYHMDHSGSAKELKEVTGAKVAANPQDALFISGETPYPKPKSLLLRAAQSFIKPAPVPVDIKLKDGDVIGNLKVFFTPGHSPGSIMLLDERRKVLFSGDTLRIDNTKVTRGPENFTWDKTLEDESIARVATLDFDVLLPGHGDSLKSKASDAVKEFANQLKREK